jgi:hypothetical protein
MYAWVQVLETMAISVEGMATLILAILEERCRRYRRVELTTSYLAAAVIPNGLFKKFIRPI